jgi:hypothetical protein
MKANIIIRIEDPSDPDQSVEVKLEGANLQTAVANGGAIGIVAQQYIEAFCDIQEIEAAP